jgi:hypothetical protein
MQRKELYQLSLETKQKLGKLLAFIGESEQQIEFSRQNLCRLTAFEPYSAFQRLDRSGKGQLSSKDLANFMR